MLHSLLLPEYDEVRHFEGLGNYAIDKYYKWPFRYFYRKKLELILKELEAGRIYGNILDYGSGPAEIFRKSLAKRALSVTCVDSQEELDTRSRFDVTICASVLEFCWLPTTSRILRTVTKGKLIIASPTDSWLSRLYFKLIGDTQHRNSEREIIREIGKYFSILSYKKWLNLYYVIRACPK